MMAYERERIFMGDGDFEAWDPQRDDYNNPTFNSYDRGPGRNLVGRQQTSGKGVTLYVQNLPNGITEEGLRNIFLGYGTVLSQSIKVSRRGTSECVYGFVDMATIREAESAISNLNGFPIGNFYLKVEIALSREEKEARARRKEEEEEFLATLNSTRCGSSIISDSESRSQRMMSNGPGGRKGRGRAGRLEELTDTEMPDTRPGLYMNSSRPAPMHSSGFRPQPAPGAYPGLNQSLNRYPDQTTSGDYQGGYSDHSARAESLLMNPGMRFNPHGPSMNFPNFGMGRGNTGFRNGPFGMERPYGRGGTFPQRGRGYNTNFAYGHGNHFSSYGDHSFVPHGRGYRQKPAMGRGFTQTFVAPELYRERSGYFTDTERFQREKERPAKRILPPKPCLNCSTPGFMRCSRCKVPYCSQSCQVANWESHKQVCQELSEMTNATPEELDERFEVSVDDNFLKNYSSFDKKKVAPKKGHESSSGSSKYSDDGRGTTGGRGRSRTGRGGKVNGYQPEVKREIKITEKAKTQTKPRERQSSGGSQKKSPPFRQQAPKGRPQQSQPARRDLPSPVIQHRFLFKNMKNVKLPLKSPVQVLVTHVETPTKIWVQPAILEDLTKLEDLKDKLNQMCESKSAGEVTSPMIGNIYAALYAVDNKWYRVKVTALQAPDTACIFFFDFGNTASVTYSKLRAITQEMTQHPVQAVQCSISDISPLGKDWGQDCMSVLKGLLPDMALSVFQAEECDQDGCYIGQFYLPDGGPSVKDMMLEKKVVRSSSSGLMVTNLKFAAEDVQLGQEMQLYVVYCESPGNFATQIIEDTRVENFGAMMIKLGKMQQNTQPLDRIPEVGEFVIGKFSYDGKWYRAEVKEVKESKVKVFYIDYGNAEEIDRKDIRQGLDQFTALPIQCVTCFLHGVTSPDVLNWPVDVTTWFKKLVTGQTLKAVVKSKVGTSLGVELYGTGDKPLSLLITEELKRLNESSTDATQTPTEVKTFGPKTECLPIDGSVVDVVLFEVVSCHCFYVVTAKNAVQSAAVNIIEESPPNIKPSQGERVAAHFSVDDTWYRAEVMEVTSEGCKVFFIDFGNEETVPFDKVRSLGKILASTPGKAIHCKLAGVLENSREHQDLLNTYKNTQVQVKALAEDSGVYEVQILLKDGKCLNEITNQVAVPEASVSAPALTNTAAEVTKRYTLKEVSWSTPPMEKLPVLVKHVQSPSCLYCQIDEPDIHHAAQIMTKNMGLYFKRDSTAAKDPQVGELFCVCYQDNWCRCVVLERKSIAVRICLIDHGAVDEVSVTDLRPMKAEFIELKTLAVKCALYGIAPKGDTWSSDAIEAVQRIEGQQLLMVMKGKRDDTFLVQLCDRTDESMEVGVILVGEGFAVTATKPPLLSSDPPILPAHLKKSVLPADGTEVEAVLSHLQDFDQIYVQLIDGAFEAAKLVEEITQVCMSSEETLMPGRGEMVCALYEGEWNRARVDNVKETNCRIFFVDYGNSDNVPFSSIKKMDPKFSQLPMQAVHCSLTGVSIRNNKEQLETLKTYLSKTPKFHVKVVDVKNDVFSIQIRVNGQIVNNQFQKDFEALTEPGVQEQAQATAAGAPTESLQSLMSATLPTDGTEVPAVAAHVQGFSSVYLQSMEGFTEVNDLMGKLNTRCCDSSNPSVTPQVGDFVCACFSVDNVWYRARVVEATLDTCTVVFVDYGNTDRLPFSMIKKLDAEFFNLPSQAIRCQLEGSVDLNSPEKLSHLQQLIAGKPLNVKALRKEDDTYIVEIKVGDEVINDIYRQGKMESNQSEILKPLTNAVLKDDETVDAVAAYIEDFDNIYIQTIAGLETLCDMMAEMNERCSNDPLKVEPVEGEYVSAFFSPDEAWYRARVVEVGSNDCKVYLVDYGNLATVRRLMIKKLDTQFRAFPSQGIRCLLEGVDIKGDSEKIEKLRDMITNEKLSVQVVGKKDDRNRVRISLNEQSINDYFRNMSQARSASPVAAPTPPASAHPLSELSSGSAPTPVLLQLAELPVDTPVEAVATHIEDFDSIVIQTWEGGQGLTPVMESLNQYCTTNSDPPVVPSAGDVVCACFKQDNTWYRARVLDVMETACKVFFLDYGNSDMVPLTEIREIPQELVVYPVQGIRCSLADVSVKNNPDKLAKLNECISNVLLTVKAVGRKGTLSLVEIFVGENKINSIFEDKIAETLTEPEVAELTSDGTAVEAVGMHIEDFNCIYVQTLEGCTALIELMKDINIHCTNSSAPFTPRKDDLVCALFSQDNTWYRARVEEITNHEVKVFFVDYGNMDIVAAANIKKLESQFRSFPIQGIRCSLSDVHLRNIPEKIALLQEKINGKKLTLRVVSRDNDVYNVEMQVEDEIINELFQPVVVVTSQVELPVDGSSVDAVVTDIQDFNAIYIQTVKGGTALMDLMSELNDACNTNPESVLPSVGGLVSAWFDQDSSWYRARVEEITDTQCKVFFVDYGNSDMVELSKIKKLDAKFTAFPLQAVRCSLVGVEIRNDPEQVLKLGEMIAGTKLSLTAVSVKDGIYEVDMVIDDGQKNVNALFVPQSPVDEEAEAIRRQIEELQLKLAAKTKSSHLED